MTGITTNVSYAEYAAINALNISKLKNIAKSPKHFQYFADHPLTSKPMTLGTAAHCATLEPERFAREYVMWDRTNKNGKAAPREGQYFDEFMAMHPGKEALLPSEWRDATAIAKAIRSDDNAMRYLAEGEAEVSLEWVWGLPRDNDTLFHQPCKARIDWITRLSLADGEWPFLIGIKTAKDVRNIQFGNQAAKLLYACQWAWYAEGYQQITGEEPMLREIVVESAAPYDVVVYEIPEDIIDYGRDEYQRLLKIYAQCAERNEWPGISEGREQLLSFPSWAFASTGDDLSDLDLEGDDE